MSTVDWEKEFAESAIIGAKEANERSLRAAEWLLSQLSLRLRGSGPIPLRIGWASLSCGNATVGKVETLVGHIQIMAPRVSVTVLAHGQPVTLPTGPSADPRAELPDCTLALSWFPPQ